MFCKKPTPLYTNQYLDLFITHIEGFNMHTGKRNPLQLPEVNNMINSPLNSFLVKLFIFKIKSFFLLYTSPTTLLKIDYEAHINTKIDYSINHVFKTMSGAELSTLHTICEVERTQLLTILAMSG